MASCRRPRGALEYLRETYLAMGRLTEAHITLARLEIARKRIAGGGSADDWKPGCGEWQELKAAIERYRPATR